MAEAALSKGVKYDLQSYPSMFICNKIIKAIAAKHVPDALNEEKYGLSHGPSERLIN